VKELAPGVPNIFCMKSLIEGHRISQLEGVATSASFDQSWLNLPHCQAGRFYTLR